jgi:hypothetical protein
MKNKADATNEILKIKNFYLKHLEHHLQVHGKTFQTRFDLHFPADGSVIYNPKQIRDFSEYMKRDLERNYPLPTNPNQKRSSGKKGPDKHKVDPRVIIVKEHHEGSSRPHYHCLTLCNGNTKQSTWDIHRRAEKNWGTVLGLGPKDVLGLVDHSNKAGEPSIMINRNDNDYHKQLEAAKQQASYLAKRKGKEKIPTRLWRVTGTRIPKD